ncbi:RDD family protein [Wohlfahrtiimonas populi]|uniref:RDD family protein n=1 Tax=Wohlfahrtiimonas populi TaxID=1940240 RepID=UPI00098D1186|nr:RDD family protein [Wohlfahrtiimonas populi]
MEQSKYQALFYGELKAGHSQEMAMRALAGAYQKDDNFFESWFSNDKTVVKREATLEEAEYIRDYLGDLGLVIQIEPLNQDGQTIRDVEKETEQLLEDAFQQIQQTLKDVQEGTEAPKKIVLHVQPAPMAKRVMAYLLDLIICMIIANLLLELVLAPLGLFNTVPIHELSLAVNAATTQEDIKNIVDTYMGNEEFANLIMQMMFFVFAVQVLYFGLMDSKYNATLGKKLFRIKVYSLISPQILVRQAALRQVFIIVAFFILATLLGGIGLLVLLGIFIMSAYDKRGLKQTLFDRLTATVVGIDQSKQ